MTRTVQLNCPIKAEIRVVDSHSDFFINFLIVMIRIIIISTYNVQFPKMCKEILRFSHRFLEKSRYIIYFWAE